MGENIVKMFIENQKRGGFMENIFEISIEINSLINVISICHLDYIKFLHIIFCLYVFQILRDCQRT